MIAAAELAIQRRLTSAFIDADYQMVILTRVTKIPDGGGGYTSGKVNLAPQRLRLIPSQDGASSGSAATYLTKDGVSVSPSYKILGTYLADIERYDQFELDGRRYEIVFISENQQYEIKGEVAYVG